LTENHEFIDEASSYGSADHMQSCSFDYKQPGFAKLNRKFVCCGSETDKMCHKSCLWY